MLVARPPLDPLPTNQDAADRARQSVIDNRLTRDFFVSADGRATLLSLTLVRDGRAIDAGEDAAADVVESAPVSIESASGADTEPLDSQRIHEALESALAGHSADFDELFQLGEPTSDTLMRELLFDDQRRLIPVAILVVTLLLALSLRSVSAALLPLINAALSLVWTAGAMALLGIPVNLLNASLPVLVLAIGATEDIHVIHEFRHQLAHTRTGRAAVRATSTGIGLAVLLSALTTVLGFSATAIGELPMLRDFGIAAGLAMCCRFGASVLVPPRAALVDRTPPARSGSPRRPDSGLGVSDRVARRRRRRKASAAGWHGHGGIGRPRNQPGRAHLA